MKIKLLYSFLLVLIGVHFSHAGNVRANNYSEIFFHSDDTCLAPVNISANNLTTTSATFAWFPVATATAYEIELVSGNSLATGVATHVVPNNNFYATGLTPNTNYSFYVRSSCGNGNSSNWVGPYFIQTISLGASCMEPLVIATLPYQTSDSTGNYGNNLAGPQLSSCISGIINYQSGNDVFYSYTAVEDGPVSFTLIAPQPRSSIFIYQNCAGISGTCLAGVGNSLSTPRLIDLNVTAGVTYTIVISSNNQTPIVDYNLLIQQENCSSKPTGLSINTITYTSANLTWNASNETVLNYQIAVQPQGSQVPSGAGAYNSTTTNISITDLEPASLYEYWVRSECTSGTFSSWAGPFTFSTPICAVENQCTYTFRMTDTNNNGWNGARMQVRQNGIVVATIGSTYTSGSGPVDVAVPLCKDVPFDIFWSVAGSQPQQCIVAVINSFGQTITTINGANQQVGTVIFASALNCETPICNATPTSVQVESITNNGGTIYWNAPATENVGFDVYLVPTGTSAPTSTTTATYSGMNGNAAPFSFIIPTPNNLLADTLYDVYVRVQCDAPSNSPWSVVKTFKTVATCPKPLDQTVTGITTTSAVLGWTEAASASQWEILLQAAPNAIPPSAPGIMPNIGINDIYAQNISGATSAAVTLAPATIYYYYVRAVCQPGNDASTWTGPFIFNTLTCNAEEKCTYKFLLTNGTNNNWNFGRMQVRQNGIVVATLGSVMVNNPSGILVALCNNVPFDLYWNQEGNLPSEMGIQIFNPFEGLMYSMLPGQGTPLTVLFNSVGNCTNTCPIPNALAVENTSSTTVQLDWMENGTASQWEVFFTDNQSTPGLSTSLNTGTPGYFLVNAASNLALSDLISSKSYSFYVRSVCSSSDVSAWSMVHTFATKPINDDCATALDLPMNPTASFTQTVNGNTLGGTASAEVSNCPGIENDDVWYNFTATSTIHIVKLLDVEGTTTNLRFSVYAGTDCETQTQIFCSATNVFSGFLNNLTVGSTYKIRVYTNGGIPTQSAAFRIGVSTPPALTNDECSTAIPVAVTTTASNGVGTTFGSVAGATASQGIGDSCLGTEDDDVWFQFVATSNMQIVSVQSLETGTNILSYAVYSGNCDNLSLLACAPASGISIQSTNFVLGQTYFVRVWSQSNVPQYGPFTISVKEVSTCENAEPFCGATVDNPYIFKNTTGLPSNSYLACLTTTPNPTYYTLKVSQSGPLLYQMVQNTLFNAQGNPIGTNLDVDFVAWGPFTSPDSCEAIAMLPCTDCPNNSTNPNFYPLGNIVDCSYSASFMETLSIPNAIAGEYYVVLITNFNGSSGFIKLAQTNAGAPNAGETACADKIQLVAFVDANSNGVKDASEGNFVHGSFTYQKNNAGPVNYITNPLGAQSIYDDVPTNTYDFNYEINPEYASYYAEMPTTFNDLSIAVGSGTQVLYFPITVTQTYSDVDVSITSIGAPRPGFQHTHKIVYRNLGNLAASGSITYTKDNSNVVINEILPLVTTTSPTGFTHNFTNLLPGEIRFVTVKLDVASIPTVNLGDVLTSSVSISSVESDINTNNNLYSTSQIVVGAYDPNDKNEARGATISIGQFDQEDYLFYTIRFQNTGTASAETVRIEDLLTSEFNLASIRMVSASHNYSMERINNKLIWTFSNINLPGMFQNEVLSQGYVTFKIKLNPGFAVGDVIENTAQIYFDTNPAIITNTFQTTFIPNLSAGTFNENSLVVYPNPAKDAVYIQLKNSSETLKNIIIYDMIGKAIQFKSGNGGQQSTINVSTLSTGMYLIEITTDSNLKQMRKLIIN